MKNGQTSSSHHRPKRERIVGKTAICLSLQWTRVDFMDVCMYV
jgi:hypothetical protein